jgi:hypothetical protein
LDLTHDLSGIKSIINRADRTACCASAAQEAIKRMLSARMLRDDILKILIS